MILIRLLKESERLYSILTEKYPNSLYYTNLAIIYEHLKEYGLCYGCLLQIKLLSDSKEKDYHKLLDEKIDMISNLIKKQYKSSNQVDDSLPGGKENKISVSCPNCNAQYNIPSKLKIIATCPKCENKNRHN